MPQIIREGRKKTYCVPISSHFSHIGEILAGLPKGQATLKAVESVEQVYSSGENDTMAAKGCR